MSNVEQKNEDNLSYDVVIVGSGSSGVRLARRLAQAKKRVALVGKCHIGGTCVNLGCVPKKIFATIARLRNYHHRAKKISWSSDVIEPVWSDIMSFKTQYINRLRDLYTVNLEKLGIDLYDEKGVFLDAHTIQVGGHKITGNYIVVAVGTKPRKLSIPGHELLSNSDNLFNLSALPRRCLIIGMGYIALETASFLRSMGTEVIMAQHNQQCLTTFDQDVVSELSQVLQKRGIQFMWNVDLQKVETRNDLLRCHLSNGQLLDMDQIFVSIGRVPNTDYVKLSRANIRTDDRGFVVVDDHYCTSQKHILALGDVIGGMQLTPVAIKQAELVTEYILTGRIKSSLSKFVPTAVFTDPEIAGVGISDTLLPPAEKDKLSVHTKRFVSIQESIFSEPHATFAKIVCDAKSQQILGLHMLHNDAAEIIQSFTPALDAGITLPQLDYSVRLHPTAAEDLLSW